jgi:hypothetical protein
MRRLRGKESMRRLRGGEVERWRSGEREGLPFIVKVWSGLLMGLGPFNRNGSIFEGGPLRRLAFVNRF